MKSEQLAEYVAKTGWGDVLAKLVHLKPYVQVLWDRFDGLKGSETIAGCRTKAEFCEVCLHRSIRAVQYMLYGRTVKRPNGARPGKQPKAGKEETASNTGNDETGTDNEADGAEHEEPPTPGSANNPNQVEDEAARSRDEHSFPTATQPSVRPA
jgi:hypothetical protein